MRIELSDLRGKPVFFLSDGKIPPIMAVRWDCPRCSSRWAVSMERATKYWGPYITQCNNMVLMQDDVPLGKNRMRGKFVKKEKDGSYSETGCYRLVLWKYDDNDVVGDEMLDFRMSSH